MPMETAGSAPKNGEKSQNSSKKSTVTKTASSPWKNCNSTKKPVPVPVAVKKVPAARSRAARLKSVCSRIPWQATAPTYSPNCAYQGTTLFADTTNPQYSKIVEVDMRGKTVWELPLYKLFGKLKKDSKPHSVERLKNGNTLFTVRQLGVFEVNPSGKLVWQYNDSGFFLDADRLANGNTLVVKARVAKGKAHVLEIAPDKKVVWSWNGLAQYDRPPYSGIEFDGWMHANAATRMANGNTWVSLRNFDIFAEIDKQGNVVTEIKLPVPGTKIPSKIAANQKKIYRGALYRIVLRLLRRSVMAMVPKERFTIRF